MARRRFDALAGPREPALELRLRLPQAAPPGYTPAIWLTEWLTLNCRGDWASRVEGRRATIRFLDAGDHARAVRDAPGLAAASPDLSGPERPENG